MKTDERTRREFGPFSVVSEREDGETFHVVTFPDGRQLRVLPDAQHSGQKRSRVVVSALKVLEALVDGSVSLTGGYDEEWLAEWFDEGAHEGWELLDDLKTDGWEIVRV